MRTLDTKTTTKRKTKQTKTRFLDSAKFLRNVITNNNEQLCYYNFQTVPQKKQHRRLEKRAKCHAGFQIQQARQHGSKMVKESVKHPKQKFPRETFTSSALNYQTVVNMFVKINLLYLTSILTVLMLKIQVCTIASYFSWDDISI